MKITIAHTKEEAREADLISNFVQGLCSGTRVHAKNAHPPYFHLYLTTPKPEKPCKPKKNA